jgi:hypothetical protein
VVFLPYMLIVFVGVGGIWLSRWVLPVYGVRSAVLGEWWQAILAFAVWPLAVLCFRHFRLARLLEAPPSLL